ncbi:hypothetical protein KY317_00820 [Candidatus Woesearchaeota archaeon]|nr:hypothetical protein [Candidatus Woesearchaeota archaeon]
MDIKKEVSLIKQRNKKVEADKAWETSMARKLVIAAITYFIVVLFLYLIEAPYPWLSAFVPTIGFYLSTLILPPIKKTWIKRIYKK